MLRWCLCSIHKSLISSFLLLTCNPCSAEVRFDLADIQASLETAAGRTLPLKAKLQLARLIWDIEQLQAPQIVEIRTRRPRLRTKTIFCLGIDYDAVYIGGHPFVCIDLSGTKYAGAGVGVGFGAGISGSVFALIGRIFYESDIVGTFSGVHVSAALGLYGGGVGVFFRNNNSSIFPDTRFREKIFWIGYEAGLDVDFSAMELVISEL